MNCPICMVPLNISERQGIEIDYCPKCRGVWLDRGELDKIIERSIPEVNARPCAERPGESYDRHYDKHRDGYDKHEDKQYHHRKRGFLHDLFD